MQIDLARLMEQHDERDGPGFDAIEGCFREPFEAKGKIVPLQAESLFPAQFEAKGKPPPA